VALSGLLSVFLIGLLGGVHCVSMCGGIVSALSMQVTSRQPPLLLHLGYNFGRIASYSIAGALVGAVGGLGLMLNDLLPVQIALYVFANLMLIALGLYLVGIPALLLPVERMGQHLWKRIQPLTRRFLPVRSTGQAFLLGGLWGWLPCGLVYSILTLALLSGSALRGAAVMLAFGLGTLPNLLMAGVMLAKFRDIVRNRKVRLVSGALVLGFGLFGLLNASTLGGSLWQGVVCHI
jgi:sulfite exporter TauE/SafE